MKATLIPRRLQQQRVWAQWLRRSTEWVRGSWEQGNALYPAVPTERLIRLQIKPMPMCRMRLLTSRWETALSRSLRTSPRVKQRGTLKALRSDPRVPMARTRNRYLRPKTCSPKGRPIRQRRSPLKVQHLNRLLHLSKTHLLLHQRFRVLSRLQTALYRPTHRSPVFRSSVPLRLKKDKWRVSLRHRLRVSPL